MSLSDRVQEHAYRLRWWVLGVLCLSLLVIIVDNSILNVALPTLQSDLDATFSQLQWMVDSYTLVFACLLLTAGSLGDRFGRKGALQIGMIVFGLGSLLSAFATLAGPADRDPGAHGHRRRVHHAVDALAHHQRVPARRAGPGDLVLGRGRRHRRRARPGERWPAARALLLGLDLPREHADRRRRARRRRVPVAEVEGPVASTLDFVGAALSIVGLMSLVYGIIEGPTEGWTSTKILAAFAIAIVVLGAFAWWELKSDHPMLNLRCSRTRGSRPRASASC